MKNRVLLIILFFGAFSAPAYLQATPINGSITSWVGDALVTMTNDTDWTNASGAQISLKGFSVTGDYIQGIAYTPFPIFRIDADQQQKADLWTEGSSTSEYGTKIISFDLTSLTFTSGSNFISAYGEGIAYMTGFDPTYATWTFDAQPQGDGRPVWIGFTHVTFVASGVGVADTGPTTFLLCLALLGLGPIFRKLRKSAQRS